MRFLTIIVAAFLSFFSTAVMGYISMAIPVGPWIAPTLALISMVFFTLFAKRHQNNLVQITFATVAGSIGGISATAVGFYFTVIYFLDKSLFVAWLAKPVYFSILLGSVTAVSGLFGLWVADVFEYKLIFKDKLAFPIGELVQKTIYAKKNLRKSFELLTGFVLNTVFCFLQTGFGSLKGFVPKSLALVKKMDINVFGVNLLHVPAINFDIWPMLWALGFVSGHVIAVPLLVGIASKILLVRPIYTLAFSDISWAKYIITFCSGMAISTALFSFLKLPKELFFGFKNIFKKNGLSSNDLEGKEDNNNCEKQNKQDEHLRPKELLKSRSFWLETIIVIGAFFGFMTYFGFGPLEQVYTFVFAFICTYQIAIISGKIGLATMGKFATFATVPAMLIFSIDYLQIVLITVIVGVAGGVASDVLFGRKIACLSGIRSSDVKKYQLLGIGFSALFVGFVFWMLINHFGLGSEQLFALRAQNRWMLIDTIKNTNNFNYYIILLGALFGFILSKVRVSPLLVLGGLFMPENITLGLICGAILALFFKNKEEKYPFWSGVYAAGSIWMLIEAVFK